MTQTSDLLRKGKNIALWLLSAVAGCFAEAFLTVFVPWRFTYEPIYSLLNAFDDERDTLTEAWRDRKLAELAFVGVTSALLAGIINSCLSWPPTIITTPWPTRALWYGAMVNNLVAISIATQQAIALNRISSYRDSTQKIRSILGRKRVSTKPASQDNADAGDLAKEAPAELAANDRIQLDEAREFWDPKWSQLFVWQSPIMLLNFSILFYLVGFLLVIIEPAMAAMMSWMSVEVKIFWLSLPVVAFSVSVYVASFGLLYHQIYNI